MLESWCFGLDIWNKIQSNDVISGDNSLLSLLRRERVLPESMRQM